MLLDLSFSFYLGIVDYALGACMVDLSIRALWIADGIETSILCYNVPYMLNTRHLEQQK
jgi:hypothetical protein